MFKHYSVRYNKYARTANKSICVINSKYVQLYIPSSGFMCACLCTSTISNCNSHCKLHSSSFWQQQKQQQCIAARLINGVLQINILWFKYLFQQTVISAEPLSVILCLLVPARFIALLL